MSNEKRCLIIGVSVRQLVASAKKGGIDTCAIDLYSDLDTRSIAVRTEKVIYDGVGLDPDSLLTALDRCDPEREWPVIYGSGVEHIPDVLNRIAGHRRLIGNPAKVVEWVCEPKRFFELLDDLDIPYPETRFEQPENAESWLVKSIGASGGMHIVKLVGRCPAGRIYYQRYRQGRIISATVLACEREVQIAGYSEQWCSTNWPARPYSYGGAVSIDRHELPKRTRIKIEDAIAQLVTRVGLQGLMSFDMILDGEDWWLLEVNPRPSATFDLHEAEESYITAHWQAFDGKKPGLRSKTADQYYRAHHIVYASDYGMKVPSDWEWPDWVGDRPPPGRTIYIHEPVCTVFASAGSSAAARQQAAERDRAMTKVMKDWLV